VWIKMTIPNYYTMKILIWSVGVAFKKKAG